jgi:hypothetical protein
MDSTGRAPKTLESYELYFKSIRDLPKIAQVGLAFRDIHPRLATLMRFISRLPPQHSKPYLSPGCRLVVDVLLRNEEYL